MTTPDNHDHDHNHDHDEEGADTVVLIDADGNEVEFGFLGFIEEEGLTYALLAPVEQLDDEESEDFDVFIFHYEESEDGEESFSEVADPATFERVKAKADLFFQELYAEDEEGEEGEEGEGDSPDQG